MKRTVLFFIAWLIAAMIHLTSYTQDSITDFDGNIYHVLEIGTQGWLKENLRSLHYTDGNEIPGVFAYNYSDSMANIYGRLYSWNAAMNNSTTPGSQGACPDGWHIPTVSEWQAMDDYLGGFAVAGGKLKEAGYDHWQPPNTGATNSSGFTGLPAGEFDANQSQNFLFLGRAAVFWTSTQNGTLMATEKYLSHDDAKSGQLAWYKTMKYSVRCIRDVGTGDRSDRNNSKQDFRVFNPFTDDLIIDSPLAGITNIFLYDLTGKKIAGYYINSDPGRIIIDTSQLPEDMYILEIFTVPSNNTGNRAHTVPERIALKCYKIVRQ
jgi:uncharacterized protein (TIGR02145 family)